MTISTAEPRVVRCRSCGWEKTYVAWVVLDLVERPDMRAGIASESWIHASCPDCGVSTDQSAPILVLRMSEAAPLLIGLPRPRVTTNPDVAGLYPDLLADARERLGDALSDVPGPIMVVPYEVLALSARRDIRNDLEARTMDDLDLGEEPSAADYRTFLTQLSNTMAERRRDRALAALPLLRCEDDLAKAVKSFPELLTSKADEWIAEKGRSGGEGNLAFSNAVRKMLAKTAEGDVHAGWEIFERAMTNLAETSLAPTIEALYSEFRSHAGGSRFLEAIAAGETLLSMVAGNAKAEARICSELAEVLSTPQGRPSSERLERAIELFKRALDLYRTDPNANDALNIAVTLSNFGYAFAVRADGDPLANQTRAIHLYEEALEHLTIETDGHSWSMAHTNLGLSLLTRADEPAPDSFANGDEITSGELPADVLSAISHLEEALRWRTIDRDPRDWAYTQINLGVAHSRASRGVDESHLYRALDHYLAAERGFTAAGDSANLAQVLHNIGQIKSNLARVAPSATTGQALLQKALSSSRSALEILATQDLPIQTGRTLSQIAGILVRLGDDDGARSAYRESLHYLTPSSSPRSARDTARALGDLESTSGRWLEAADAWEIAAMAAAKTWEARATSAGRLVELHENVNVFRWAAYANAKAGRSERAIELLEAGRARELALWLEADSPDLETVREIDPTLAERYESTRRRLRALDRTPDSGMNELDAQSAELADELVVLRRTIRQLPGFSLLNTEVEFRAIAQDLPRGEAIAYLLSSPVGLMGLVVTAYPKPLVRVVDISSPTSTSLSTLFVGDVLNTHEVAGYISAHEDTTERFLDALSAIEAELRPILKSVRDMIRTSGERRLCLIPISLLGLLPLHAFSVSDERCETLLDAFEVVFAPSAGVLRACRRRTHRASATNRAVIIGNPMPQRVPLSGAEFEARMVAQALAARDVELLIGEDATKARVLASLPGAEIVHFACHGRASILDQPMNAALSLAHDEPLLAEEILDLTEFAPRLVVASACETGVVQGYVSSDEAISLGSTFVAAGAAAVISTLWSVSDTAAALLMTHFYEDVSQGIDYPAALRDSQLWLRDSTDEDIRSYVETRDVLRGRLAQRNSEADVDRQYSFSSITEWGAFVFTGT